MYVCCVCESVNEYMNSANTNSLLNHAFEKQTGCPKSIVYCLNCILM